MEIRLRKYDSAVSNNKSSNIGVNINSTTSTNPCFDTQYEFDEYKQFLKERNDSEKYRLAFTINPLCTNVLYNMITEIVYKEGSEECIFVGNEGISSGITKEYNTYTKRIDDGIIKWNNRKQFIRDTAYSHNSITEEGAFVYHCGNDIFNNHTFRGKKNIIVNKMSLDGIDDNERIVFNTLFDYKRNMNGKIVRTPMPYRYFDKENNKYEIALYDYTKEGDDERGINFVKNHIYEYDTVYTYLDTLRIKKIEDNGWFGFKNATTTAVENYSGLTINKIMNNNKPDEFIDFYPDRSLYSFLPKYNKYRNRYENNWDFCIVYPYENYYDNPMVTAQKDDIYINGLECYTYDYDEMNFSVLDINEETGEEEEKEIDTIFDDGEVYFRTFLKNDFYKGCQVKLCLLCSKNRQPYVKEIETLFTIDNIGDENGNDSYHIFSVNASLLMESLYGLKKEGYLIEQIRVIKVDNGVECEYYFRKFKKIDKKFNISLNKLAFGRNIYNDQMVQLVFNEDVDTTGLVDNLGRQLSEIYLMIIKRNKGHELWYTNETYSGNTIDDENGEIEFSHCFGKVTDGLDLNEEIIDYNVHFLHNVNLDKLIKDSSGNTVNPFGLYSNVKCISSDDIYNYSGITIDDDTFFGDVVEFNPNTLEEKILEDVYQRFNTAQRECTDNEFKDYTYDDINRDDYDLAEHYKLSGCSFEIKEYRFSTGLPKEKYETSYNANICPEGYYYNPKYKIKLRKFEDTVNEGYHTKVYFNVLDDTEKENGIFRIETVEKEDDTIRKNYYFEKFGKIFLYSYKGKEKVGEVTSINSDDFCDLTIKVEGITDIETYDLYKPNILMPSCAYEIKKDGGRYVWKEIIPFENIIDDTDINNMQFTNGSHYMHKNINFYLKRQDPHSIYGMNYDGTNMQILATKVDGKSKDINNIEYKEETENKIC